MPPRAAPSPRLRFLLRSRSAPATVPAPAPVPVHEDAAAARTAVPVGLAAGVGPAVGREGTDVKAVALPTLALPAMSEAAGTNGHQPESNGAATGDGVPALNGNGSSAPSAPRRRRGRRRRAGASDDQPGDGVDLDALEVAAMVERVPVQGTSGVDLLAVGAAKSRYNAAGRRRLVEELVASADRYDIILLDLPVPEASPLVPPLLRISTQLVAVVPAGAEQRASKASAGRRPCSPHPSRATSSPGSAAEYVTAPPSFPRSRGGTRAAGAVLSAREPRADVRGVHRSVDQRATSSGSGRGAGAGLVAESRPAASTEVPPSALADPLP